MKKFKKPDRGAQNPSGRVVAGIHAVTELIKVRPQSITEIWFRDNFAKSPELEKLNDLAKSKRIRVSVHNAAGLNRIVEVHQGIVAFSNAVPEVNWEKIYSAPQSVLIALDEVEDPHNIGAIMRTAWLLGVSAVLSTERRSALLSASVSKVAQGALEHVPMSLETSLPETLKGLKDKGFWIFGLSGEGKKDIYSIELPEKVVWVLGSESSGLRKSVAGMCDELISIPQSTPGASYNVSVAAAMALGETHRQSIGR